MNANTEWLPYDLTQIPRESLVRLAKVFREGEQKYGRDNWRGGVGDQKYQLERANHALAHLLLYIQHMNEDSHSKDDLAKIMWFCATQMELERIERISDNECAAVIDAPIPVARIAHCPECGAAAGEYHLDICRQPREET